MELPATGWPLVGTCLAGDQRAGGQLSSGAANLKGSTATATHFSAQHWSQHMSRNIPAELPATGWQQLEMRGWKTSLCKGCHSPPPGLAAEGQPQPAKSLPDLRADNVLWDRHPLRNSLPQDGPWVEIRDGGSASSIMPGTRIHLRNSLPQDGHYLE